MRRQRLRRPIAALLLLVFLAARAMAHDIVTYETIGIPIQASFDQNGRTIVQVEIDLRALEDGNPNTVSLKTYGLLKNVSEAQRTEWKARAKTLVENNLDFRFEPFGATTPDFKYEFTSGDGAPLKEDYDVVVITATWQATVPPGATGYSIHARDICPFPLFIANTLLGKRMDRTETLYAGNTSFVLDLTHLRPSAADGASFPASSQSSAFRDWLGTFAGFVRMGFTHVVPEGYDHILFVLGLFLLSRQWKPLLLQVTTFTVAHSLTLGLAALGFVHVSSAIVEPLIAGSITIVALENIFHPRYTHWRLLVVFSFGLVHGLGFASALQSLPISQHSFVAALLGFNVGVECGQLAIITAAFIATIWITNPQHYRHRIVVPCSLIIASLGFCWMVMRIAEA